jgi:AraC-like DNA-binding protein
VPAVLASLGANPAEVLGEVGLNLELFEDPDNRISYLARGRLLAHCAARTDCPHFGLLVGQQAGLHSFGLIGLLARSAPDAETALRKLLRYFHVQARGATTVLNVTADLAILSYLSYQPRAVATDQVGDASMAIAFNMLRELCGADWRPAEIWFAHREPQDVGPYRRFFRAPVRFGAEQYAVVFSASWLTRALPGLDPALLRLLQAQVDKLDRQFAGDFAEQVRSVLRHTLVHDDSSADRVAALFSMHRRTLNRRLSALGVSFLHLVDEVSFAIASELLAESSMEIAEVAGLLDYANASAFTRAFRRWSGTTPAQWRAAKKRAA